MMKHLNIHHYSSLQTLSLTNISADWKKKVFPYWSIFESMSGVPDVPLPSPITLPVF